MTDPAQPVGLRVTPRGLTQVGVIGVLVWLVFTGTAYLKGGVYSEQAGVEFNVAAFGLIFALAFLFTGRPRASLVCTTITLLALAWFTFTGGTNLPGWMGLDWLFPSRG